MEDQFIEWVKTHKVLTGLISVGVCLIIALIINGVLSWNIIPSIGTGRSDWLCFWGSFLGGIIGGFATLIGVLMTLNEMGEDRKAREEKDKPIIMPLNSTYEIKENDFSKGKYEFKYSIYNKLTEEEKANVSKALESTQILGPYIKLLNITDKNALEVEVLWEKPLFDELKNSIKYIIPEKYYNQYNNIKSISESDAYRFRKQIIPSIEEERRTTIYQYKEIQELICLIIDMVNECIESGEKEKLESLKNIPMGDLIINYKDIFGCENTGRFCVLGTIWGFCLEPLNRWYGLNINYLYSLKSTETIEKKSKKRYYYSRKCL